MDLEQVIPAVGVIALQHQVVLAKGNFIHGHGISSAEPSAYQAAGGGFSDELAFPVENWLPKVVLFEDGKGSCAHYFGKT